MLVEKPSRQVLRHEVGWVSSAQNLPHGNIVEVLLLLNPQGAYVYMPEMSGALAVSNSKGTA